MLALSMLTAGCATTQSSTAPSPALSSLAEGRGRVIFYRPSGIFGFGQTADILLDGRKVGTSASGTKFYVDTTPGTHRVTIPNILYSGERVLDVLVREGQIIYVRTSLGGSAFGGRTNVELIDGPQGAEESANLELVAPE